MILYLKRSKIGVLKLPSRSATEGVSAQLATLEERTKHLQGLEERIEKIKDKQDSDSRELRERLYSEYSKRLQDSVDLLKDTYGKMNATTANAFREITDRNAEVYKQTARQLINLTERLESAFKMLEQREHAQMRDEMKGLKQKIDELEQDPLRIQLEELADARTAQAVHEQSVKKITTMFWSNNGEVKFQERIGQYQPDVFINNHRIRIVADEVTTDDVNSVEEKVKKVAAYMRGVNANVGYVIIPNSGIDPEALREIKRTVPERGLYVVRITEYAVHLEVWYDIAMTGVVDTGALVEKGHNFLQVLEPIFDEFLAVVQNLEQRDERDFKYRQNRYKEIKLYPSKILNALEKVPKASD
jgi:polyhydroxyalkanoate synthesis regulator phasin